MTCTHLGDATWPTVPRSGLVLVPVGSIEQHGPHLPLDTDTAIAAAVAHQAAELLHGRPVTVAPPIAYGASGEHQGFAGTSSIGTETLVQVVVELVRSLRLWARAVVLVNAHGGNADALTRAVEQLVREGHAVTWLPCATEEVDLHAGFTETSIMLRLRPASVRSERAEVGNTASIEQLLPAMRAGGVLAVSPNGVLGDPSGANAEDGRIALETMANSIADNIAGWPRD